MRYYLKNHFKHFSKSCETSHQCFFLGGVDAFLYLSHYVNMRESRAKKNDAVPKTSLKRRLRLVLLSLNNLKNANIPFSFQIKNKHIPCAGKKTHRGGLHFFVFLFCVSFTSYSERKRERERRE